MIASIETRRTNMERVRHGIPSFWRLRDTECGIVCAADCADDPVLSAVCDDATDTCACECDTSGTGGSGGSGGMGGSAGVGGSSAQCVDGTPVQEAWPTGEECDSAGPAEFCDSVCATNCVENGFDLGSAGSACTDAAFGSACECTCVYCQPN
jgi:hypothetical protein